MPNAGDVCHEWVSFTKISWKCRKRSINNLLPKFFGLVFLGKIDLRFLCTIRNSAIVHSRRKKKVINITKRCPKWRKMKISPSSLNACNRILSESVFCLSEVTFKEPNADMVRNGEENWEKIKSIKFIDVLVRFTNYLFYAFWKNTTVNAYSTF